MLITWSARLQQYDVYKDGRWIRSAYRYRDVKSYSDQPVQITT